MTRYNALKAQRLCISCARVPAAPGRVRCASCQAAQREAYRAFMARQRSPALLAAWVARHPPPLCPDRRPRVAHCGVWHPIAQVPFTAPCCGITLFREEGEGRDIYAMDLDR
jgi:hypothetical protein